MGKKPSLLSLPSGKPFAKHVHYNHIMPTRYMILTEIGCNEAEKAIQQLLQEKFVEPPKDENGKASKDVLYLKTKQFSFSEVGCLQGDAGLSWP